MHAASRLFSWSMVLLALASRLFAPKMLDHLLYIFIFCNSNPCLFVSESSERNRCTCMYTATKQFSSSMYEYVCCRWTASTAKHNCSSAITAAQSSIQPRTCRSEYVSKVRTYTLASSRLFSCSMELLAFASRLFAPKMLDHLLYICL